VARVLRGGFPEGDTLLSSRGHEVRLGGVARLVGQTQARIPAAAEGETVAFARLEGVATGEAVSSGKARPGAVFSVAPPEPVYALRLASKEKKDDVRLSAALTKLVEEDPSLVVEQRADLGEMRLAGQGEMHLRVAIERLERRFGVPVETGRPAVGYRESIRDKVSVRARHKKQTGGHGQFGDVAVDVAPLPRGEGFAFTDRITGGVVPRQYIPSVETGVRAALDKGPLGFPVIDVAVTLTDGSYHTVDSSDMAFQQAARLAMAEALPKARPVLLEPVMAVEIVVPSDAISRATGLVTARRGQILGIDGRPGWPGWEVLKATIPEADIGDLIVELRSATSGVGGYTARLDHLAEVTGRTAEAVIAGHAKG
jgi:elongation factor G